MLVMVVFFIAFRWIHLSTPRSEERFSRNAETDLVCRLLLEKKKSRAAFKSSGFSARSIVSSAAQGRPRGRIASHKAWKAPAALYRLSSQKKNWSEKPGPIFAIRRSP